MVVPRVLPPADDTYTVVILRVPPSIYGTYTVVVPRVLPPADGGDGGDDDACDDGSRAATVDGPTQEDGDETRAQ